MKEMLWWSEICIDIFALAIEAFLCMGCRLGIERA